MEHPAEEWGRAVADLEPVRLEFDIINRDTLRRGARIAAALLLTYVVGLTAVLALTDGEGALCFGGFILVLLGVGLCTFYGYVTRERSQSVALTGMTLRVVRRDRGAGHTSEFELLRVHDLRAAPESMTRFSTSVLLMGYRYRAQQAMGLPEPIVFSYRGERHSFGGAPMTAEQSSAVLERIKEYDRQVRERLGMPAEPDITTYDARRALGDLDEGWDNDVPIRFLY